MSLHAPSGRDSASKTIEIQPAAGWPRLNLTAVWRSIDIIYILALRDIKVRYKQSFVGFGWAILQPLLTMIVFTAVFNGVVKVPTGGVPYPLFALSALVPWSYFVHAVTKSTICLVADSTLINRVYFPRLVMPISSVVGGLVDFFIAFALLMIVVLIYDALPGARILFLPLFLLLGMLSALALGLWLSALNVQYRDVNNGLPFFIQVLMFISPVAYPAHLIPEKWQWLYAMNPMASVINGFRWVMVGEDLSPHILTSVVVVFVALVGGLYFFRWQEDRFADVI